MYRKECILIVDDDTMNLKAVSFILVKEYNVVCVQSGKKCLDYIQEYKPDMILLDLYMPEMDGFEVLAKLKEDDSLNDIPVILLTADDDKNTEVKGFKAGAVDFITKPFIPEIVLQRVSRIMELYRLRKSLEKEVARQIAKAEERRCKMEKMSLQAVHTLAMTIDAKDSYTNGHSYRVAEYSALLAQKLGWSREEIEDLRNAALLHDIGKIGIPDSILNKPGKLTDEEYNIIKAHASMGGEIMKCIDSIPDADLVARHHHERYDGTGYPDKLSGENIPKCARIVAIADSYDAMNSRRVYRNSLSKETIREELVKGIGTQFEEEAVRVFIRMLDEGQVKDMETNNPICWCK